MAYYQIIKTCHEMAFGVNVISYKEKGKVVLCYDFTEDLVQLKASFGLGRCTRKSTVIHCR